MPDIARMEASWLELLKDEFQKPNMQQLEAFLAEEINQGKTIYPPVELMFNAFCQTSFHDTKVVIIGQDPYHGPGQAHGLSFSVPIGVALPPSLQNIFKELKEDVGASIPNHGCLIEWANQGVMLLNATLTVRANEPKSHYGKGWEIFTDRVVQLLASRSDPVVFILWGRSAMEKCNSILNQSQKQHLILSAPHPSPFSAHTGFFGCRHFSKTNHFLAGLKKRPIDWNRF